MNKKILLILFSISIIACTTDTDEINDFNKNINELNSVVKINDCTATTFNFNSAGNIEVINDEEFLYVTVSAFSGYFLSQTRLHISRNYIDFPGNGNLPPGKMDFQEIFPPQKESYTFKLLLSNYGSKILIASNSSFSSDRSNNSYWVGDILVKKGNWAYFEYKIQECEPLCTIDAGYDNLKTLTRTEAVALPSWDEVRKLYLSLLGPGVSTTGTFNPSIQTLINRFQSESIGNFTTEYTIVEGDCKDSVDLTLRVIPD